MRLSSVSAEHSQQIQRTQPWLGTLVSIRVDIGRLHAAAREQAERAIEGAFAEIAQVHQAMSFQQTDSELSQLNRCAHLHPQSASAPLFRVLQAALALARASGGRFDPTIGSRLVRSGHLPAPQASAADPAATWSDVVLHCGRRIHFRRPLWLDLGGIAKGYAVDRALAHLRRSGLASAIVNAGGDLRSFGTTHIVHVRDPANPVRSLPLMQLRNAAVATSAGYFSCRRGETALVDPLGGRRLGATASVTVCAPRAIWADALTKVVLGDPDAARLVLRRLGARALWLDANGARRQVA